MLKRSIALLVFVTFLPLAAGATPLLHHHDDHDAAGPCQVCYLIKATAVALAIGLALLLILPREAGPLRRPVAVRITARSHHAPAAPRAPPCR